MMEPIYENPPVREGINSPPENVLWQFFSNLFLVAAGLGIILLLLNLAAMLLASYIPFAWERAVVGENLLATRLDRRGREKEAALRDLARRVATELDMPAGMDVSLAYNPRGTINAYATFGGNIVFYQGLLNILESEDEVAMVLAHEMSHIIHRDAMKGMFRALGLLVISLGLQSGEKSLDYLTNVGMAGYSRRQEASADRRAVGALVKLYGHAGGATAFFQRLAERVEKRTPGEMKETPMWQLGTMSHPDTLARVRSAREAAESLGFPATGALTPLTGPLVPGYVSIPDGPDADDW